MGREFLGIELKPSYFDASVTNLTARETELKQTGPDLRCPEFNVFDGRETYGRAKQTSSIEDTVLEAVDDSEAA